MKNALRLPVIVLAILCLRSGLLFTQQIFDVAVVETQPASRIGQNTPASSSLEDSTLEKARLYQTAIQTIGIAGRYYQRMGWAEKFNRYQWEYHVVAGEELNCFALPDGRIALFKGLAQYTDRQEQLAYVVGHAIGHVLAGHEPKNSKRTAPPKSPFNARTWARMENVEQMALGLDPVYRNADEQEADRISLTLMRLAGYDLKESVSFWESVKRRVAQKNLLPPGKAKALESRINALKAMMPEVIAQNEPLPKDSAAVNGGFFSGDTRDTVAGSAAPQHPTPAIQPVPQTGACIFIQADVIPSSGVQAAKIDVLGGIGPVSLDETVVEGFNYTRILVGDCVDINIAKQKLAQVREKGFGNALVAEYVDGKRSKIRY